MSSSSTTTYPITILSQFLGASPASVQMSHISDSGFITKKLFSWIKVSFIVLALFTRVTWEDKVEDPSSALFCISDCSTCPVICSPPPPSLITPSPSPPHSPSSSLPYNSYFSPPPPPPSKPKLAPPPPQSHSSGAPPPPPFNSYTAPPSGLGQPLPTVVSAPHDFSYPYYYFYASAASSPSLHAPFFLLVFFLVFCRW
ncbi:leucine-rich repeat extensin-like protein 2 [Vigna radiata var. radiata]|uniref:Leucine-rich repeat extensin-like protein 2 n=1 Tax=Vigna radiata var. radiata TaxID=3916 RepID=A0A1S3U014_VIGRR|nr:leucine-rich repeat extensin-like protein 2 [Vigna radiata var. radiata]